MAPHVEDQLLDFAYGELSEADARAVSAHLEGCVRCADALKDLQGVRRIMSKLPEQAAPDAGLQSLLAYAEQTARRTEPTPAARPSWWSRLIAPLGGLAALAVVFVVAKGAVDPDPAQTATRAVMAQKSAPAEPAPEAAVAEALEAEPAQQLQAERPERRREEGKVLRDLAGAPSEPAPRKRIAPMKKEIAEPRGGPRPSAGAPLDDGFEAAVLPPAPAAQSARGMSHAGAGVGALGLGDPVLAAERLSQAAWAAYRRGDRREEASLLRQALATGTADAGLLPGLLNRLCDAEYALGNAAAGEAACRRVVQEFPGQGAAELARQRLELEGQAQTGKARPAAAAPE